MQESVSEEELYMKKVAVLGAGSWGTALAIVLADNNCDVRLWTYKKEQAEHINETHKKEQYLDPILPKNISAYNELKDATDDGESRVMVVTTNAVREVCEWLNDVIAHPVTFSHASKGIERGSLNRVSQMISEEMDY